MGGLLGGRSPPRHKNGVFIRRSLIFRVGGENKKINSFRIIGQGNFMNFLTFKISTYEYWH